MARARALEGAGGGPEGGGGGREARGERVRNNAPVFFRDPTTG